METTTRTRVRLVGLLASAAAATCLLVMGCSVTKNRAYCDEETPCTDADAPYCHGDTNRCSDVPVGEPCGEAGQCSSSDEPICFLDVCVECEGDRGCNEDAPVCDPRTLSCGSCASDSDCSGFLYSPYCQAGECVDCRTASDCKDEVAPVCDEESSYCRSCQADSECASTVCELEVGSCADASEVLIVAQSGSDDNDCTADSPCKSVSRALELVTEERYLVVVEAGSYIENLVVSADVTIVGRDALIYGDASETPVVHVTGGVTLRMRALTIRSGSGSNDGHGIACESSTVELDAVSVLGNAGDGIHLEDCSLTMTDSLAADNTSGAGLWASQGNVIATASSFQDNESGLVFENGDHELSEVTVSGNSGAGVTSLSSAKLTIDTSYIADNGALGLVADGAAATLRRSTVFKNRGGGIRGREANLTVTNNMIVRNGRSYIQFPTPSGPSGEGGIRLVEGTTAAQMVGHFEHNTIVDNYADQEYGSAGIICGSPVALPMRNNLIAHNTVDPPNLAPGFPETLDQVSGDCTHTYTLAYPIVPPGEENVGSAPKFVDRAQSDYHLTGMSPGLNKAASSDLAEDFDGEGRPYGDAPDIGADEVTP